jgi:hypothetical protein
VQQELGRAIRVAGVNADLAALATIVGEPGIEGHLQAAGEALLSALDQQPEREHGTAPPLAESLVAMLEQRDWTGDPELAALLRQHVLGQPAPTDPSRRAIRADLDQVADLLEGTLDMGFGGVLDTERGDAWPERVLEDWPDDEPRPDPDEDPERYLFIPNEGSREAWRDMQDFAYCLDDDDIREQLLDAIDGRGAFSRFKRALDRHDGLRTSWHAYSTEARTGRARAWLNDAGYDVLPSPRNSDDRN